MTQPALALTNAAHRMEGGIDRYGSRSRWNGMTESPNLVDEIRAICRGFQGIERLYLEDAIDARRLQNARKAMKIPENETVVLLYDDALLGSNKAGFAVCAGGLYWENDWSVDSRRTRLSWQDFARRKSVKEKDLAIELTRGDRIGIAVLGEQERGRVVAMLGEIQALCRKKQL